MKRKPGELAEDETIADAEIEYKRHVFNRILDTAIESIHSHYAANAGLGTDVSCINPKCYPEVREKGLPDTAMRADVC